MTLQTIKQSRFWSFAAALLLVAQLALSLHAGLHGFDTDTAGLGHDCAICQVATTMASGGKVAAIAQPAFVAAERVIPAPQTLPLIVKVAAHFQSRAPPISV